MPPLMSLFHELDHRFLDISGGKMCQNICSCDATEELKVCIYLAQSIVRWKL